MPRRRPGAALVELALSLPIMAALLTGIADIGYLYNHQLELTNAAREGARVGALGRDGTAVKAAVLAYLNTSGYQPMPVAAGVLVSLTGGEASVSLASTVPFLFGAEGAPITLHATSKMRLE